MIIEKKVQKTPSENLFAAAQEKVENFMQNYSETGFNRRCFYFNGRSFMLNLTDDWTTEIRC